MNKIENINSPNKGISINTISRPIDQLPTNPKKLINIPKKHVEINNLCSKLNNSGLPEINSVIELIFFLFKIVFNSILRKYVF